MQKFKRWLFKNLANSITPILCAVAALWYVRTTYPPEDTAWRFVIQFGAGMVVYVVAKKFVELYMKFRWMGTDDWDDEDDEDESK